MKFKLLLLSVVSLAIASCSGNNKKTADTTSTAPTHEDTVLANAPSNPPVNMEYCFYFTEGTQAQDTTSVNLHINGDKVTGEMKWIPKEKDARKGALVGVLKGNAIRALWTYGQEGTTDTLTVAFQLRGNELAQKPYRYDAKTGKQETNGAADYTVIYRMKNCTN